MKFHYFNILLLNIPLNILIFSSHVYDKKNACNSTTPHVPKTKTTKIPTIRLLCECELYAPPNNDYPEMKALMQNFDRQTQQRFHEYDERMVEKRMQCKDKCDKEIQKIILKDKLEKQMKQELTTLETKITTDDIPTCVCEKSIADKVEKGCLKCTQNFGGIVAPSSGVLAGIVEGALSVWKPAAIIAAKDAAAKAASDAAIEAGIKAVILKIEQFLKPFTKKEGLVNFTSVVNKSNFKCPTALFQNAKELLRDSCIPNKETKSTSVFCNSVIKYRGESTFETFAQAGATAYDAEFGTKSVELEAANVGAVEATYASYQTAIIASIVAIVVIVLIMVIIYKILRYRRKKKMKKKLQYIKLLEE
ncbi:hypothetical protein PFUGPA_00687 [Plasmodium falciparum Palo Alto/Uganda]|uniref:Rifin n=2 Tax=Plasmodium falciparum TaxID=5833 RepID=W4J4M6_PLAFP|nr:hypothetical protein PFUGPA_00687 [Plasmodium falciparum Palo Alto/Uganda]ETW58846.1 hypothetical protein PFMC_05266 [Plasmodium falciparum CAMP/Malaysia]